jgi:hypothetical protein
MTRKMGSLLLSAIVVGIASAGCGTSTCKTAGEPCGSSVTCCGTLVCPTTGGTCEEPMVECAADNSICVSDSTCCSKTCNGADCVAAGSCTNTVGKSCSSSVPCCAGTGLTCTNGRCEASACSADTKPCADAANCCAGLTCYRYNPPGTCHPAVALSLGDPCRNSSECASGNCQGWCTSVCATTSACTSATECAPVQGGTYACFPFCQSNKDCTVYGPGVTCQPTTNVAGVPTMICSG